MLNNKPMSLLTNRLHFTLIEVLIAIVLSVISLVSGYRTMAFGRKHVYSNRFHVEAQIFANDVLRALAMRGYEELKTFSDEVISLDSSDPDNVYYKPLRESINSKVSDYKHQDVTADLSRRDGELEISISKLSEDVSHDGGTDSTFESNRFRVSVVVRWIDPYTGNQVAKSLSRFCYE